VEKRPVSEAQDLRALANKLRQRAREAVLSGYAAQLNRAADDVERQAEKREALS